MAATSYKQCTLNASGKDNKSRSRSRSSNSTHFVCRLWKQLESDRKS
ncbi:hypothetical protein M5D96_013759 [Drosophila gunungcola]|uniref:Uncharacterized protein n=1 Tax=Drosophila gunungcola TaxID=103775 RepID=A0A9Q0BJ30_9MUSC|nr:hypothetical protein M5D96_013759 [Drosophila gunungcola]